MMMNIIIMLIIRIQGVKFSIICLLIMAVLKQTWPAILFLLPTLNLNSFGPVTWSQNESVNCFRKLNSENQRKQKSFTTMLVPMYVQVFQQHPIDPYSVGTPSI